MRTQTLNRRRRRPQRKKGRQLKSTKREGREKSDNVAEVMTSK